MTEIILKEYLTIIWIAWLVKLVTISRFPICPFDWEYMTYQSLRLWQQENSKLLHDSEMYTEPELFSRKGKQIQLLLNIKLESPGPILMEISFNTPQSVSLYRMPFEGRICWQNISLASVILFLDWWVERVILRCFRMKNCHHALILPNPKSSILWSFPIHNHMPSIHA